MKNKALKLLLLILIVVLATGVLFACNSSGNTDNSGSDTTDNTDNNSSSTIDKSAAGEEITNALLNAGTVIDNAKSGTRHVTSEYTLRVNNANVAVYYQANYSLEQAQDSEIMLRVYNYAENVNMLFVYYDGVDLYYSFKEQKIKVEGFGSTASFKTFYDFITLADMSRVLFDDTMASYIGQMASSFADAKNISKIILSDTSANYTIKNINLDSYKTTVNDFITDKIAPFGEKFDALTSYFLGVEISDIARAQVGLFTAEKLFVLLNKKDVVGSDGVTRQEYVASNLDLTFSGNQANYEDDYYFNVQYATSDAKETITLDKLVDPDSNVYEKSMAGHRIFGGTLAIPAAEALYDAEIRMVLDAETNANNQISARFTGATKDGETKEPEIAFYYKDGVSYLDCKGILSSYVGSVVDYAALGFPKLKSTGLNVTNELKKVSLNLFSLLSEGVSFDSLFSDGETDSRVQTFINKSNSKDGVFSVTIDSEFIKDIVGGDSTSVIESVAELFGIQSDMVKAVLDLGYLDDLCVVISYNTNNGNIAFDVQVGGESELTLTLEPEEVPADGTQANYPDESYFGEEFKEYVEPEVITLDFEADMHTIDSENGNISTFLGLFMGDISGTNTTYPLSPSDRVLLSGSLSEKGDETYINANLTINGELIVAFATDQTYPDDVYVDNRQLGVKYKMSKQVLEELIAELASDGKVWSSQSFVQTIAELLENSKATTDGKKISLIVSPYKVNNETKDPLKELIGVENFYAALKLSFRFAMVDAPTNTEEYCDPKITVEAEQTFGSIYEARWQDTAKVSFGGTEKEFALTFKEEITTNKSTYRPKAKLFGKTVEYVMQITDANGTKVVWSLASSNYEFDPIDESPLPDKIGVVYEDGTEGKLKYRIIGFTDKYNNGNIGKLLQQGMAASEYTLIIGEGSIGEKTFGVTVSVKSRVVKPAQDNDYIQQEVDGERIQIPVVAHVTIDPYEYYARKAAEGDNFHPIVYDNSGKTELTLKFYEVGSMSKTYDENVDFDWNFDDSYVKYSGGEYNIVGKYKSLYIALNVIVEAKEVNYIKINSEENGYYTIDSLVTETYTIPTKTTFKEVDGGFEIDDFVRVYFKDGHYRVIGAKPEGSSFGFEEDTDFDGYFYKDGITWKYAEGNYLHIDGSKVPLNGEASQDTATFGESATIGRQTITLNVVNPSRNIGRFSDNESGIVSRTEENGNYVYEKRADIQLSEAWFDKEGTKFFKFDPYSSTSDNKKLPNKVYLNVIFEGKTQKRAYDIVWDDSNGIVDKDGNILADVAEETYLIAYGTVGDGDITQRLTMAIHNLSIGYSNVEMYVKDDEKDDEYDEYKFVEKDGKYYVDGLNPYQHVTLPTHITLKFPEGSGVADKEKVKVTWFYKKGQEATGQEVIVQEVTESTILPSGNVSETVVVYADVKEEGMRLPQRVELNLNFVKSTVTSDRIYGVYDAADKKESLSEEDGVKFAEVDTYSEESAELYNNIVDNLMGTDAKIGIGFSDGSLVEGIPVVWENIQEFISVLEDPRGSSSYYNNGDYKNDVFVLKGTIYKDTVLKTEVKMNFKVGTRIVGSINLNNIEKEYTQRGDSGEAAIEVSTSVCKYIENATTGKVEPIGANYVNITFNKMYALRIPDAQGNQKLATPKEYINYVLQAVTLGFGSKNDTKDLTSVLPDDFKFNECVYGTATNTEEGFEVKSDEATVSIIFTINKLSSGSCVQPTRVTLVYLKDAPVEEVATETVELFNADGTPKYDTTDGYTLSQSYDIEYAKSGKVTYDNLEWKVAETIAYGGITKPIDESITNISSELLTGLFSTKGARTFKLYATLPDGTKYQRHISVYPKDIQSTKYSTPYSGKYKVVDGELIINNVYEYLPVASIAEGLVSSIVPNETQTYIGEYDITFRLENGWVPSAEFAGDDGKFDIAKMSAKITSQGLTHEEFATGTIVGYNGERQTVKLYITVRTLNEGKVTHKDYNFDANRRLVFDQYSSSSNNGTFVLPKDITVTFGSNDPVSYTFGANADIKFAIKNVNSNEYEDITAITYNNKGHTLGSAYGEPNDPLNIRVTLPDGNSGVSFSVVFPNREINSVYYAHDTDDGVKYIEGVYYVDPYDASTYTLPIEVGVKYKGTDDITPVNVKWTPYDNAEDAFTSDDSGNYRYKGGSADYFGKGYAFYSSLRSFDDQDATQYFVMQVYVLDRRIESWDSAIGKGTYEIDNPFTAIVDDIPSEGNTFVALESGFDGSFGVTLQALNDELKNKTGKVSVTIFGGMYASGFDVYAAYTSVTSPVTPAIKWYTAYEANGAKILLENDDISISGGFNMTIYGVLGYGEEESTFGQTITLTLTAAKWSFIKINMGDGDAAYIVEVNEYTGLCIEDQFGVKFQVTGTTDGRELSFYPEDRVKGDADKMRSVISWEQNPDGSDNYAAVFYNNYKKSDANRIRTEYIYKLDRQMIGVDEIDFGYGDGMGESGNVDLVIDPLNPYVPLTATAQGVVQKDGESNTITFDTVNLDWVNKDSSSTESIYNMPMGGGSRSILCNVTVPGSAQIFPFVVNVTYLNRKPTAIYTEESGYTTEAKTEQGYYTLMQIITEGGNEQRRSYFTVNPTPQDVNLYVQDGSSNVYYKATGSSTYSKSAYILPRELMAEYPAYDIGSIEYEAANTKLGTTMYFTNVEWVLSRDITLVGTSVQGGVITAKVRKFTLKYIIDGKEVYSEEYDYLDEEGTVLGGQYDISLTTVDRTVESTYIIVDGEEKTLSEVPQGSVINYQKAADEFYIDPYAISFPDDIYVVFKGVSVPYHATNVEWTYDESYLSRTEVISGRIGADAMYTMGTMKVYGTELSIQFTIKGRNINITKETASGEETQEPLVGGTLYVIKDRPVSEQLPDHLYYRFEYDDGTAQIASVPLKFSETSIANISTAKAGNTYSNVKATLGWVDDDNITFTIIVIDPKLYTVNATESAVGGSTSYSNGGFYYDYISVGVNTFGAFVAGPEGGLLPDKVIVTDGGAYMDIVSIAYDVQSLTATVRCKYVFRSFSDSRYISGDAEGYGENSDKMYINFTVPLKTYEYNKIETDVSFSRELYSFPFGKDLTATAMPATTSGISPFWDMTGVNRNKAGVYEVQWYLKNAYGKIISDTIKVEISKTTITSADITWKENDTGESFLNRTYDGKSRNISEWLEIGEFLREDGKLGALNGYTVEYSTDGGSNWSTEQPTDAGNYLVRIIVKENDDYNVTGSVEYTMHINKREVKSSDVYFYDESKNMIGESEYKYIDSKGVSRTLNIRQIEFTYSGKELLPGIASPEGATYETSFAIYDPTKGDYQTYDSPVRPVNAGVYIMRINFPSKSKNTNFTITDDVRTMVIVIKINPKTLRVTLARSLDYTGYYMNAKIENLDAEYPTSGITYTYDGIPEGDKIRNAGTYKVTISFPETTNYIIAGLNEKGELTGNVEILKREVVVDINTVESEYLDELKSFDSAMTFTHTVGGVAEEGIVGTDNIDTVRELFEIAWDGGTLTYKHMVGDYTLISENDPVHNNYTFTAINAGTYKIVAYSANTEVIENKAMFDQKLESLKDGDVARWYLKAGNYGTLTLNKNASLSVVGCYDLNSEDESIAVTFESVTVEKGALQLDIVAMKDKANGAAVTLGANASNLNVSRSKFYKSGANVLTGSMAIRAKNGYEATVYVDESEFTGFNNAIYLESGSVEVNDSVFEGNTNGVVVRSGDILLRGNTFKSNTGRAVDIVSSTADASILDNKFIVNNVAIRTAVELRRDISLQNEFRQNAVMFDGVEFDYVGK